MKTINTALAVGLTALSITAIAQTQGYNGTTGTTMNPPMADTRGMGTAMGTDQPFNGWMGDYATKNNGRISRKAYMDEAGRRWDAMDRNRQGLTPEQLGQMYGYGTTPTTVDSATGRAGGPNNKGS